MVSCPLHVVLVVVSNQLALTLHLHTWCYHLLQLVVVVFSFPANGAKIAHAFEKLALCGGYHAKTIGATDCTCCVDVVNMIVLLNFIIPF